MLSVQSQYGTFLKLLHQVQLIPAISLSTGNSVLWELHIAGNFSLGSTEPQAVVVVPEIVRQVDLDVGNHTIQQIPQSSHSARNQDQASRGPQSESADLENYRNDPVPKSLERAQGDMEQSTSVCPADHDVEKTELNLKETLELPGQPIDLTVSGEPFGHVDLLNEDTQLNEDLLGTSEIVTKAEGAEVVEVVEIVEDPKAAVAVADPVVEELVVRIRMAHGLQCLDMTQNGLSAEDVKQLWEAWCDGGRMAKKEFMGKAHFAVQDGRECSALISSCASCQPRT
jgi:hypothetical protein